jgi:hypothetical protein
MRFLMDAAYRNCPRWAVFMGGYPLYSSRTEDNMMLDDVLNHAERFDEDGVYEHLRHKHRNLHDFLHELEYCTRQVFFATERGFVGNAPYDVRQLRASGEPGTVHSVLKDDLIVVPRGASMPWVLRARDVEGEYKLIVDCFVEGIMKGELMALVESGQLQTQSFTLV